MGLYDIVEEAEKTAAEEEGQDFTDEEIKEAYAAGRIAGAAYKDELNKLAQKTKTDEMGVAHKDNEGATSAQSDQTGQSSSGEATVDQKRKDINQDQKAVKDTNNDQGANTGENSDESDGPKQNSPEDNKDNSATGSKEAAVERVIEALSN